MNSFIKKNQVLWLVFCMFPLYGENSAITYDLSRCGRLGDKIVTYCKAKYLSEKFCLPFLFKPFAYSDNFAMHFQEQHYSSDIHFAKQVRVRYVSQINPGASNTLYLVDMYTFINEPTDNEKQNIKQTLSKEKEFWIDEIYEHMQEDLSFKHVVKKMLKPVKFNHYIKHEDESRDAITIAVHIRKGSNGDRPLLSKQLYTLTEDDLKDVKEVKLPTGFHDVANPLKFVPEQYYINQINKLVHCFPNKMFRIFIFTDSPRPAEVLNNIKTNCNADNCIISLKTNQWQDDGIKDICEMAQCDCLIRSCSHFAGVSQFIGCHKLIISPKNYCWAYGCLIVTENNVVINDPMFEGYSKVAC